METLLFLKGFWTPKLWIAAGLSAAFAFFLCLPFKEYTPLPEFWVKLNSWLFLLSGCNTVFHEAGHVIFGIFGFEYLAVAGGTLGEWLMPLICFFALAKNRSLAGLWICIFWFGMALVDSAFYAADAKQQVLILINGLPGNESGMHDWGFMLTSFNWEGHCSRIGQFLFLFGAFFMALPLAAASLAAGRWAWNWASQ